MAEDAFSEREGSGRRQADRWRDRQIAKSEALATALDALVAEMRHASDGYPRGEEWDKAELAVRGWADRLAAEIATHRETP